MNAAEREALKHRWMILTDRQAHFERLVKENTINLNQTRAELESLTVPMLEAGFSVAFRI